MVIRDILHAGADPVRWDGSDDPSGGVLDRCAGRVRAARRPGTGRQRDDGPWEPSEDRGRPGHGARLHATRVPVRPGVRPFEQAATGRADRSAAGPRRCSRFSPGPRSGRRASWCAAASPSTPRRPAGAGSRRAATAGDTCMCGGSAKASLGAAPEERRRGAVERGQPGPGQVLGARGEAGEVLRGLQADPVRGAAGRPPAGGRRPPPGAGGSRSARPWPARGRP